MYSEWKGFRHGQGMRSGFGRGRGMSGGLGPSGYCICLKCGYKVPKQRGVRCMDMKCPNCGSILIREGSEHHQLYLSKKKKKTG